MGFNRLLKPGVERCMATQSKNNFYLQKLIRGKIAFRIAIGIALITAILFSGLIFLPRTYKVPPIKKRINTQFWVLRDGSTMGYFLVQGKGEKNKSPIIYLHGGPGGHITDNEIQSLAPLADSGFNVYLYDQMGSGQSQRLNDIGDYTVARHVEDLNEIIDKIYAGKVILIGQSWGAILAAMFVAKYPDKVEKIIFTSPGPIFPVNTELVSLTAPDSLHLKNPVYSNAQGNRRANNLRTRAMAFFATRFRLKLAGDKEADEFATLLSYEVNKSTVCDTANIGAMEAGNGFYSSVMTFSNLEQVTDPRPNLQFLKLPVLVLKGQCDNQPWGFTQEYQKLFQNSELVLIPNAGHFISLEQPALFLKAIGRFLNK
jgi:proline iminopeptidase